MRVLAGDVGGTNARLSIWEAGAAAPIVVRTYPSRSQASVEEALVRFLREFDGADGARPIERACVGVAGVVEDGVCRTANLPWAVDRRRLVEATGIERLVLVNDFEALASAVPALTADDVVTFGGQARDERGPIAVLGPGTGFGQAFLVWGDTEAGYRVIPSEGGHSDFAPRTPLEAGLARHLQLRQGRVSIERVLSGAGLVEAFQFLAEQPALQRLVSASTRAALLAEDPAAVVSSRALDGSDPVCVAALSLFASVLGAVAGNLALDVIATGGVFIGGGIAPRIVEFLKGSTLRSAFEHKGRRRALLERIPLSVIVRDEPGLLGAAMLAGRD